MLAKLAARNVKRQIGNYLIYFITVTVTVALMFSVNNAIFSEQLSKVADTAEMRSTLISVSCAASVIVAFVLGYATSFMVKLRKREFGTYLTLGMTRGNILTVFLLETTIMGILALVFGVILGLFVFQGIMALITNLLELPFVFSAYSAQGALLTVGLVAAVFILSSSASALYLRKVKVYDLIHGDKKVAKRVKHPGLWFMVTLLSFAGILAGVYLINRSVTDSMSGSESGRSIFATFVLLACSLFLFHLSASRSLVGMLLRREKLCASGTNTFTLRQLSGTLGSSSVMAGAISFLLAFAVVATSVGLTQKVGEEVMLDRSYPFDIMAAIDARDPVDIGEAEKIIGQYNEITTRVPYNIYTSGDSHLHKLADIGGAAKGRGPEDSFIAESDYDRVMAQLGKEPADLHGGFKILTDMRLFDNMGAGSFSVENNGLTCGFEGVIQGAPMLSYVYFIAVVPDEFVKGMKLDQECYGIDLKNDRYDAAGLSAALEYEDSFEITMEGETQSVTTTFSSYSVKEAYRQQRNQTSAVVVVALVYISVVFIFMAIAILSLKTLAGISDDKQRYEVLKRLGADEKMQSQSLFRQIFSFFMLPFAVPALLSIPTGYVCGRILEASGFSSSAPQVYWATAFTVAVMAAVYILYFTATYLIAKRNVIKD